MIRCLSVADVSKEYEKLAYRIEDLSKPLQVGLNPVKSDQSTCDYAKLLEKGWKWLFEKMAEFQPKAYEAIASVSPGLCVGERLWSDRLDPNRMHWSANAFLILGESFLVLHPDFMSSSIEELGERHPCYERFCSLPREIAESYYYRVDGIEIAHKLPVNSMESRILPSKISVWAKPEVLCLGDRKRQSVMRFELESLVEKSGDSSFGKKGDFRVFLDTRAQDNYGEIGDALLVQVNSACGRVFHVKDSNFKKLRIVNDPVALLDNYVEHVLSLKSGSFDFLQFSS